MPETDRQPRPVLVLGLGNVLCGDDGVGVVAVDFLLREYDVPPEVRVVDGGTLGLALLDYFDPSLTMILVDAVRTDAAPGTLLRFESGDVIDAVSGRLSPHQVGVADLLNAAAWIDRSPARLVLLGITPADIGLGLDRTPSVEQRIPDLVAAVVAELRLLGHAVPRRDVPTATTLDVARALLA